MKDRTRWILATILLILLAALLFWIGWDVVNCMNTGGVFVKGLPWYTCIK